VESLSSVEEGEKGRDRVLGVSRKEKNYSFLAKRMPMVGPLKKSLVKKLNPDAQKGQRGREKESRGGKGGDANDLQPLLSTNEVRHTYIQLEGVISLRQMADRGRQGHEGDCGEA